MNSDAVRLTREELYEQVWSEPISKLAQRYGLSDVGLAKICRRLRVPVPYRGYWRKKEVGQTARRTPLPTLRQSLAPQLREVTLRPQPNGAEAEETGPVAEQEHFESLPENRIAVAEVLENPHPLVAQTVAALRRAKPDEQGYLRPKTTSWLAVRVTLDSADRAMCILDALLKALDARGYATTIRAGDQPATIVRIREEELSIAIEERIKRVERTPPARPGRHGSTWAYPQYDWEATGQLALKIENTWGSDVRQTWSDAKQQRLEGCLNSFTVGLVKAAEGNKAQRLEREARERERRAAEERRLLDIRRREEEASRVRALDHVVGKWRRARLIREYVGEVRAAAERAGNFEAGSPLAEWLMWAEGYANRIDPLLPDPSIPQDPEPRGHGGYGWSYSPGAGSSRPSDGVEGL